MTEPAYTLWNAAAQAVLPELAGGVDLIVTSPPYGKVRDYGGVGMAAWDFAAIAPLLADALAPGGVLVWIRTDTIADYGYTGETARQQIAFQDWGLVLHDVVYWQKQGGSPLAVARHAACVEPCMVFSRGRPRTANIIVDRPQQASRGKLQTPMGRKGDVLDKSRRRKDVAAVGKRNAVWYVPTGHYHLSGPAETWRPEHHHPAAFPYRLAADFIRTYSLPGDTVLDPMAGSGTVIRAAVDLRRRALGIEVVPAYCDAIRERMSQAVMPLDDADSGGKVADMQGLL